MDGWQKKTKILYILSIFTGSAFAAVSLVNSFTFRLQLFDMGLTDSELLAFTYKRVYSVVLLENIPQLCLQIWYLSSLETLNDPITISSMIFSFISILVSVLSMVMEKQISQSQGYVAVTMRVTGNAVVSNAKKCKTLKKELSDQLALFVGVHSSVVEVIRPIPIKQGFEVNINFYFGDSNETHIEYFKVLTDGQNSGELQTLFKESWKLSEVPIIDHLKHTVVQSKIKRKRTQSEKIRLRETGSDIEMDIKNETRQ